MTTDPEQLPRRSAIRPWNRHGYRRQEMRERFDNVLIRGINYPIDGLSQLGREQTEALTAAVDRLQSPFFLSG